MSRNRIEPRSLGEFENVGNLESPREKYLIIDGQHRLAALHSFRKERPDDAAATLIDAEPTLLDVGSIGIRCWPLGPHSGGEATRFHAELKVVVGSVGLMNRWLKGIP